MFCWVSALVKAPGTCGAISIACATFSIFLYLGIFEVFILRKRTTRNPKLYHAPLLPVLLIVGLLGEGYLLFATFKDSPSSDLLGVGVTL
ncbi:hypothetical protein [Romboutsia sp.]|uniref:hypothetical protein n=1 Tax=Romboutsia sp. TaxID=1965302 RepID=UPI003F2F9597